MTSRTTCQTIIAGLLLGAWGLLGHAQEMRTWSSQAGQTVMAALLDIEAGQAVLRREDGVTVRVPVDSFADADRQRLQAWLAEHKGTGAVTTPTGPDMLAAFADGPWKGANTVYQGRFYDAVLAANGRQLELHVKENGTRVGKPIAVAFGCHYYDPAVRNTVARPIAEFATPPATQLLTRPGMLKLNGRFADEVRFAITLKFAEKSFSLEGEIKDPPRLAIASNLGYHARVLPTHSPPPEMELEQIKALMPDWTLALSPLQGKTETHPYWKSLDSQGVERAQIRGPWQGRTVSIKAPAVTIRKTKTKAGGYFAIYKGMAPYTGYHVGRSGTSDQEAGELIVAFE